MSMSSEQDRQAARLELTPQELAAGRAAASWVSQLARTLKTCRLYDANNPTVVRFREELAVGLRALIEAQGPLTLRFTANDVLLGEQSLYPARSRDDNLAAPFFRDGIRSLTFSPGIEAAELETVLDLVLRLSAPGAGDEDLVTLLWDAQLVHVDMSYVSAEADVDGGEEDSSAGPQGAAGPTPWPRASAPDPESAPVAALRPEDDEEAQEDEEVRSDDWTAGVAIGEIDASLHAIETSSAAEVSRFRREYESECAAANVSAALAVVADCMDSGILTTDLAELSQYLPRLLAEALSLGRWSDAQCALALMRRCEDPAVVETALSALAEPGSTAMNLVVRQLDQQSLAGVQEFLAFARETGTAGVEWLMSVLAESQQQRVRRPLTRVIAELTRDNPERLAPWLSDERWYVVRNVVHILGWIRGAAIAPLLGTAAKHPEPRVRQEVVAALAQAGTAGHPLMLGMLDGAHGRVFSALLHQLSGERDPDLARRLLGLLMLPAFAERPPEERRAVYLALASVGGDGVLPDLEAELHRTRWFSSAHEQHRQSVARCIARIGTPTARLMLERGAASRNAAVRKASEEALAGGTSHD